MANVQVPATQGTPAPPAQAQASAQGTPWDNDLAFIEDESIRSQVSDYLGQKVQPYVTQLEQRSKPAVDFFEEFNNEPGATTLGIIEEVYGADAAKSFADYLTDTFSNEGDGGNPAETQQPAQTAQDPRLERMLNSWELEEQEREWKKGLAEFQTQHADVEIDDLLFRPFAAMTDGDLDQALVGYQNFLNTAREKFAPGEGTTETGETEVKPPPALGTQGGGTPPPVEPTGQSIGDAIEGWVNDLRAQGQTVAPPDPNA